MRIIFFGTPVFAAEILLYLISKGTEVVGVITKPDKPLGRSSKPVPTPVKQIALEHHIPYHQPEKVSDPSFSETLQSLKGDLFVVVAYGEIIKQHVLDMPKKGCINLHASLLPKYRGAAPIPRCIMSGETESGVTVIKMVKKMDAGEMLKQAKVSINENMTSGELEAELCELGKKTLIDTILEIEYGTETYQTQDESKVTFAPKIELEDFKIDWNQKAYLVHNLIRAGSPKPGAWCEIIVSTEKKKLKILESHIEAISHSESPRTILNSQKNNLIIACKENAIKVMKIQLEGKKAMHSKDFLRGIEIEKLQLI